MLISVVIVVFSGWKFCFLSVRIVQVVYVVVIIFVNSDEWYNNLNVSVLLRNLVRLVVIVVILEVIYMFYMIGMGKWLWYSLVRLWLVMMLSFVDIVWNSIVIVFVVSMIYSSW